MSSPPPSLTVIETTDLAKSYGRFGAIHGLNLSVPAGSVFALMGASGAGKTTVIKILMNMVSPSRGTATLLGVESRALDPAVLARIGYVSENQALPARLRVEDFFAYLRPLYADWDRHLEQDLRAQFRLPAKRKIGELSHGMRMKMALACALPFHPALLILDEPLSGLDALARDEVIGGFLRRSADTTVLISSHELDEVERFATHVAFLDEGQLLFQGSMDALAEHARPLLRRAAADAASGAIGAGAVGVIAAGAGAGIVGVAAGGRSSLRDIFVAMVRAARQNGDSAARRNGDSGEGQRL